MIETTRTIELDRQAAPAQQRLHLSRKIRGTRCPIVNLVGMFRETVVVINHGWLRMRRYGEALSFPVSGDDQDGARLCTQLSRNVLDRRFQPVKIAAEFPFHVGPGTPTMRQVVSGQT